MILTHILWNNTKGSTWQIECVLEIEDEEVNTVTVGQVTDKSSIDETFICTMKYIHYNQPQVQQEKNKNNWKI